MRTLHIISIFLGVLFSSLLILRIFHIKCVPRIFFAYLFAYFMHIYLRIMHILHIVSIFFAYYFAYLAYFSIFVYAQPASRLNAHPPFEYRKYAEYAKKIRRIRTPPFFMRKIRKICIFSLQNTQLRAGLTAAGRSVLNLFEYAQTVKYAKYALYAVFWSMCRTRVQRTETTLQFRAAVDMFGHRLAYRFVLLVSGPA